MRSERGTTGLQCDSEKKDLVMRKIKRMDYMLWFDIFQTFWLLRYVAERFCQNILSVRLGLKVLKFLKIKKLI